MLLIKNGKILTMSGNNYENGCVLIKDKKIEKVGVDINIKDIDDCQVIDATNCWVMPGIIESHCHIGIIEEKKDSKVMIVMKFTSQLHHT